MDKRTVIAFVLSFVVLIGWTYFIAPMFSPVQPAADNTTVSKIPQAPVENAAVDNVTPVNINKELQVSAPEELTTEKSKLMEVTFNTATGDIRSVALPAWEDTEGGFVTFNKNGVSDYAKILTPVSSGYTKKVINLQDSKLITFTAQSGSLIINKSYQLFDNSYLIKSTIDVTNTGSNSLNIPVKMSTGRLISTVKPSFRTAYALVRYVAARPFTKSVSSSIDTVLEENVFKVLLERIKEFFYS